MISTDDVTIMFMDGFMEQTLLFIQIFRVTFSLKDA